MKKAGRLTLTKFGTTIHANNGTITPVKCLLKKLRETGSMDRRRASGWPRTVTKEKIMELIEKMFCSQEEVVSLRVCMYM